MMMEINIRIKRRYDERPNIMTRSQTKSTTRGRRTNLEKAAKGMNREKFEDHFAKK